MKKILSIFIAIIVFLTIIVSLVLAEEDIIETEEQFQIESDIEIDTDEEEIIEELEEISLLDITETVFSTPVENEITEDIIIPEYDYKLTMSDLTNYNLVALHNLHINSHTRGSIWVGGVLTGSDWCGVDDGSINHHASNHYSYIYVNESNIYFQGRTDEQSPYSFRQLTQDAVSATIHYWQNIFPLYNDDIEWIYIKPDNNGYVNLQLWNYQSNGSDETIDSISRIYWTDATKIDMGGLGGHLIAPFADINITWCNYSGCIVGWNITTNGEGHINSWEPKLPSITPTPTKTPIPTNTPTIEPTATPTITPTPKPTTPPTLKPTVIPTIEPTSTITIEPTTTPTLGPTPVPTETPTATPEITIEPTITPEVTLEPTATPEITLEPTITPTVEPTPTPEITKEPTPTPTIEITPSPTPTPVPEVIIEITNSPSPIPVITKEPTATPTVEPSPTPTIRPTDRPIITTTPSSPSPTPKVTTSPTETPSPKPIITPTLVPTKIPTPKPTPKEIEISITTTPTLEPIITPHPTLTPQQRDTIIKQIPPIELTQHFINLTEEELTELIDIFDYEVPLYGGLLKTGDDAPLYILILIFIGVSCIVICIISKKYKP